MGDYLTDSDILTGKIYTLDPPIAPAEKSMIAWITEYVAMIQINLKDNYVNRLHHHASKHSVTINSVTETTDTADADILDAHL